MTVFRHAKVSPAPTPGDTYGFPFCQRLWALTKRRDDIVVADMVADMEVDKVADKASRWHCDGHRGRQDGHGSGWHDRGDSRHGGRHVREQRGRLGLVDNMVADMEVDMVANMEVDMVADMEVDKVTDMVADIKVDMVADIVAADMKVDMEVDMVADMEVDMVAKILELHTNVRNAMQYHVIPYNTGQFYEANLWTLFFF